MLRGGKMPCGACAVGFTSKPCEHPTGKINSDDRTIISKTLSRFDHVGYVECMVACYKELRLRCPCKVCLVKVTCNVKYDDRCSEYKDLIDKVNKKYYDETTGLYKELEKT